jgi:hypothetical protein
LSTSGMYALYFRSGEVQVLYHGNFNGRESCMRRAELEMVSKIIIECRRLRAEIWRRATTEWARRTFGVPRSVWKSSRVHIFP